MELILYPLIALAIAIAIGALFIMLSTKMVGGFGPSFGSCALAAVAAVIGSGIASYVLQMVLGASGVTSLLSLVVLFLVYAAVINLLVKRPDGSQMGFGRAALVTLVVIILEIVVAVALVLLFGTALMALIGMH